MFGRIEKTGGSKLDELERKVDALVLKLERMEALPRLQGLLEEYTKYCPQDAKYWAISSDSPDFFKQYPWSICEDESRFRTRIDAVTAEYHRNNCEKSVKKASKK